MKLKIKKATKENIETIATIETKSGYKWKESFKEELKIVKRLFNSKYLIYLAEFNGEAIGYIVISIKNKNVKIDFLSVIKKYHKKGVGTKLLSLAIKLAIKNKAKRLKVEVWDKNLSAINLYNKFGFSTTKIKQNYYPNRDHKLIMERRLK